MSLDFERIIHGQTDNENYLQDLPFFMVILPDAFAPFLATFLTTFLLADFLAVFLYAPFFMRRACEAIVLRLRRKVLAELGLRPVVTIG